MTQNVAESITQKFIECLENGSVPWKKPWVEGYSIPPFPRRSNRMCYRGVNIVALWIAAYDAGYENPYWFTYRQAGELGGQVRKGEKATRVVYYGTVDKEPSEVDEDATTVRFARAYAVFNGQQIDGLPDELAQHNANHAPMSSDDRQSWFDALGADIRHGGDQAAYSPNEDRIYMPAFDAFSDPTRYWATRGHETVHWTSHPTRLNRPLASRRDIEGYAFEELIAEIGSAFLGAQLGLPSDHIVDHAGYVDHWLSALRRDTKLIFKAAAKAQEAVDFLNNKVAAMSEIASAA